MRFAVMPEKAWTGERLLAWMSRWGYLLCFLITVGLGVMDLTIPNANISIGYTMPVILCALLTRRATPWSLVLLVIVSTITVYMFKSLPGLPDGIERMWHYRMLNRSLVILAIVGVALLSGRMDRLVLGWKQTLLGLPAPDQGEELFAQLDRLLVAVAAVMLLVVVFCIDLWAPPYINLPILYALPLVLMSWSCRAKLLWIMTPVVVLMPLTGLMIGLWIDGYSVAKIVVLNRLIATVTVLGVSILLQVWIRLLENHIKRNHTTKSWGT